METQVVEPRPIRTIGPDPLGGGVVAPRPTPPQPRRAIAPNATLVERLDLTPTIARYRVRPDTAVPSFRPGSTSPSALRPRTDSCSGHTQPAPPPGRLGRSNSSSAG